VKKTLISPEVLSLPVRRREYSIDTDASKYQVGVALFQTNEENERKPIGYWSRSLTDHEKNYSTTERECLALVWGVVLLRPYLQFVHFTAYTDHAPLRWLMSVEDPSGRLIRWRIRLSEYDFDVEYKKGKLNTQADALSRFLTLGTTPNEEDLENIPIELIESVGSWEDDYEEELDAFYEISRSRRRIERTLVLDSEADSSEEERVLNPVEHNPNATDFQYDVERITYEQLLQAQRKDPFCRTLKSSSSPYYAQDEYGLWYLEREGRSRLIIPQKLVSSVVHHAHYSKLSAHPGGKKMYFTLSQFFYWPSMAADCYGVVSKCLECAKIACYKHGVVRNSNFSLHRIHWNTLQLTFLDLS